MQRTTSLSITLLAALGIFGLNATAAAAAPQPAPPLVRVMPLGDSITAGEGSSGGAGYRSRLWELMAGQSRYTADFVGSGSFGSVGDPDNEGHSGWTIDGIRSGINQWQTAADPDVVLLHIGINDLKWHNADPVQTAGKLSALVDTIQANRPGVAVIVQGLLTDTPGLEQQTRDFNAVIQGQESARRDRGERFRYVEPPRLDAAAELPDQLHPNDAGYRKIAQAYHEGLEQAVTDGWAVRPRAPRVGSEAGGAGAVRWADFDGDGRPDRLTIADSGEVKAWLNHGGDTGGGWQELGRVATGLTTDRTRVRFADFDGDGRADYWLISPDGGVNVHLNLGGDTGGGWKNLGKVAWGTTTRHDQVRLADFDGDGRADYTTIADNGALSVHLNRGGDPAGAGGWYNRGQVATGTTTDRSRVRLADYDGDGRADYTAISPSGALTTYLNRGGDGHGGWQFLGQTATGVTTDHNRVHLVDFDDDTHADYLLAGANDGFSAYLFNGGDPSGPNGWTPIGSITGG
ncbi:VCBS repeat-containing protein [Streptomyces sp. ISL-43]|uniref:FG-GAP-like repeat-containing protein n=1 Tax=Streptomyces sp. ISL-43 TaxID=2819183 RepID=UPI001BEC9E5E|nr:FG-GAP-like repeat-containing protein [Streptomyces sp. ISL-43]MBT2451438.1 VCBS repeat-containing protein [Streptomyces sp. ISL-43]